MKRHEIENVFDKIVEKAEKANSKMKFKRFYVMVDHNRGGKRTTVGIYDYIRKKHVLSDVRNIDIEQHLRDMEELVSSGK